MERQALYAVLLGQQQMFWRKQELVPREAVPAVVSLLKLKLPLIIAGVRRCGKSSLMMLVRDELKQKEKECLFVDFSDERFVGWESQDFQLIEDFLVENGFSDNAFLFLDEVQEVRHWEKWVNRLKEKHPILITGSNSKLLSKEIASTLTGRSVNLRLEPFSFKEFLATKKVDTENYLLDGKKQALVRRAFKAYFREGGFPKMVLSGDKTILRELYENILYRDVIARLGPTFEKPAKELSVHFLANPTEKMSSRRAGELMGITNLLSVKKVLDTFENSFLFFFLSKFDYSVKKQIQNPRKSYCVDNGFVSALGFRFSGNEGKRLENLVAIELKRRGKDVYYFSDAKECDFVVRKGSKMAEALQVTWKLSPENREREVAGLREALDRFRLKTGTILTHDQEDEFTFGRKKIVVKPVWKWLLENEKPSPKQV